MEILHENSDTKGRFFMQREGKLLAEMTYVWAGKDTFIIDHTEVSDELRGTGAGKQLVAASVAFAKQQHVRVLPLCPFAKSVFDKTPEYQSIRS